mmetsp:Transcript_3019/g.4430  ORF Transcript_3019/g.4430 Transcript_3019/m.4430 type:complete len:607 (+) Transcript_3019:17-1837(+)
MRAGYPYFSPDQQHETKKKVKKSPKKKDPKKKQRKNLTKSKKTRKRKRTNTLSNEAISCLKTSCIKAIESVLKHTKKKKASKIHIRYAIYLAVLYLVYSDEEHLLALDGFHSTLHDIIQNKNQSITAPMLDEPSIVSVSPIKKEKLEDDESEGELSPKLLTKHDLMEDIEFQLNTSPLHIPKQMEEQQSLAFIAIQTPRHTNDSLESSTMPDTAFENGRLLLLFEKLISYESSFKMKSKAPSSPNLSYLQNDMVDYRKFKQQTAEELIQQSMSKRQTSSQDEELKLFVNILKIVIRTHFPPEDEHRESPNNNLKKKSSPKQPHLAKVKRRVTLYDHSPKPHVSNATTTTKPKSELKNKNLKESLVPDAGKLLFDTIHMLHKYQKKIAVDLKPRAWIIDQPLHPVPKGYVKLALFNEHFILPKRINLDTSTLFSHLYAWAFAYLYRNSGNHFDKASRTHADTLLSTSLQASPTALTLFFHSSLKADDGHYLSAYQDLLRAHDELPRGSPHHSPILYTAACYLFLTYHQNASNEPLSGLEDIDPWCESYFNSVEQHDGKRLLKQLEELIYMANSLFVEHIEASPIHCTGAISKTIVMVVKQTLQAYFT